MSHPGGSNSGPSRYECDALPSELGWQRGELNQIITDSAFEREVNYFWENGGNQEISGTLKARPTLLVLLYLFLQNWSPFSTRLEPISPNIKTPNSLARSQTRWAPTEHFLFPNSLHS